MKAFLFLSSLLLVAFVPILSHASVEEVSFERICREATTGDHYNFCVATLQGIPFDHNTTIQELAMTAVEQLLANISGGIASLNYPISDGVSPDFSFGKTFKCIKSIIEFVKDMKEVINDMRAGDVIGAVKDLSKATNAAGNCLGVSSSDGEEGLLASIFKVINIVIEIAKWLTKTF